MPKKRTTKKQIINRHAWRLQSNFSWQPWIDFVNRSAEADHPKFLKGILNQVPEQYRLLYALALSVAKWHPLRNPRGGVSWATCGLCAYFQTTLNSKNLEIFESLCCGFCPLKLEDQPCYHPVSLYHLWESTRGSKNFSNNRFADALYELLMRLYAKEYKKVLGL